jgi:hypothetical protein
MGNHKFFLKKDAYLNISPNIDQMLVRPVRLWNKPIERVIYCFDKEHKCLNVWQVTRKLTESLKIPQAEQF